MASIASNVPPPQPEETEAVLDHFAEVDRILRRQARRLKILAGVIGGIGLGALALAAKFGLGATREGLQAIEDSGYRTSVVVFELVRTAAAAALLAAFIWGMLNLARAALDQSTRYEKRLIAGHFLVYVLTKFEDRIGGEEIALRDVMTVFTAWSDSVDSAFTHVKFGSKDNQGLAISGGPAGFSVATGGAKPIPPPAPKDAN